MPIIVPNTCIAVFPCFSADPMNASSVLYLFSTAGCTQHESGNICLPTCVIYMQILILGQLKF